MTNVRVGQLVRRRDGLTTTVTRVDEDGYFYTKDPDSKHPWSHFSCGKVYLTAEVDYDVVDFNVDDTLEGIKDPNSHKTIPSEVYAPEWPSEEEMAADTESGRKYAFGYYKTEAEAVAYINGFIGGLNRLRWLKERMGRGEK